MDEIILLNNWMHESEQDSQYITVYLNTILCINLFGVVYVWNIGTNHQDFIPSTL